MPRRFVIQYHTSAEGGDHYDLMIEQCAALATWRLTTLPRDLAIGQSVPAGALPDHRLAYLEYEGPISAGRGQVRIVDRGACEVLADSPQEWQVELNGADTRGWFRLRRLAGDAWELTRLP